MRLYLSSFTIDALEKYTQIFPEEKLNILLSYGLRNANFAPLTNNENVNSLIIDSGTFTLNKAQNSSTTEKITLDGYLTFLKYLEYEYAFSYDKYFGTEEWLENYKLWKKTYALGYDLVPVIHSYGQEEIDAYLRENCKIIALGFSKEFKKKKYIAECAKYIHDNGSKVHLLGGTNFQTLAENPISYCDSSSWVQHVNFGVVMYWDGQQSKKFRFADFADSEKHSSQEIEMFNNYIKQKTDNKLSYEDLIPKKSIYRQVMNIRYFIELQDKVTNYQEKNEILK